MVKQRAEKKLQEKALGEAAAKAAQEQVGAAQASSILLRQAWSGCSCSCLPLSAAMLCLRALIARSWVLPVDVQMNQAQLQLQQEEQEERKQLEADMQVQQLCWSSAGCLCCTHTTHTLKRARADAPSHARRATQTHVFPCHLFRKKLLCGVRACPVSSCLARARAHACMHTGAPAEVAC